MFKNILLIFISLISAIVFWLATVSSQQNIKTFDQPIPVRFFDVPEGIHASSDSPFIKVKIDISKEKTKDIPVDNFQAFVDLSNANIDTGKQIFPIEVTSTNQSIRIVSFVPKEIEITLENIREKSFQVEVEYEGELSDNYQVERETLKNKWAALKAGESVLNNVDTVKGIVSLSNEEENFKRKLKLQAFDVNDKFIPNIVIEPEFTEVEVFLTQIKETKTVGIKVPIEGDPQEGLYVKSIQISPSTTEIEASKKFLEPIEYVQTKPLDISTIKKSTTLNYKIIPPLNSIITGEKGVKIKIELEKIIEE